MRNVYFAAGAAAGLLVGFFCGAHLALQSEHPSEARLVGLGCIDQNGGLIDHPVYAAEEDHFPSNCKEIHSL